MWNRADIYGVASDNGLHYVYPSAFAVLMVPFADPPPAAPHTGYFIPYAVSVAAWYLLNLGFVAATVHLLAKVVLPDARRGTRRWWFARTVPVYACIGGIGFTLGRGQVNLLIVALVAAMFAAAVRGRRVAGGAWLGAAIALKVIPAFLLLFPAVRRDWRASAGVAVAVAAGWVALPVAIWGWAGTVKQHTVFARNVLLAGITGSGGEQRFAEELTETTATDSQSFQAALHHVRHLDQAKWQRPPHAGREARLGHWAIALGLTAATLLAARRRLTPDPADQLVFLGCLCAVMMLVTPVSHMHYYAFVLPAVAALWLKGLAVRPGGATADARTTAVLAAWAVATALPLFPGSAFELLRECGLGAAATVGLWAVGLRSIGWKPATEPLPIPAPEPVRRAA